MSSNYAMAKFKTEFVREILIVQKKWSRAATRDRWCHPSYRHGVINPDAASCLHRASVLHGSQWDDKRRMPAHRGLRAWPGVSDRFADPPKLRKRGGRSGHDTVIGTHFGWGKLQTHDLAGRRALATSDSALRDPARVQGRAEPPPNF